MLTTLESTVSPLSNHALLPNNLPTSVDDLPTSSDGAPARVGPYRIEQRLGAGGMGEVFRAVDERLQRPVALKRIRPGVVSAQARQRFRREARVAARLNHPRIVKIHDLITSHEGDWIVLEFLEGEALDQHLQGAKLDLAQLLALALDIVAALEAAHREGVVHRDLKPGNVFITSDGRAKVLDFGLAKQVLYQKGKSNTVTLDGQVVGTPRAMSPEQVLGHRVDLRSDLFSLGSLLYELFSARSPFHAPQPLETLNRICSFRPEPLAIVTPGVPLRLSNLVENLLEKDPAHRPFSAGEVFRELQRITEASAESPTTITRHPSASTAASGPTQAIENAPQTFSEQRQITILCCELVTSGGSSGCLDPSGSHSSLVAFEAVGTQAVERYEGQVANALGHRLVIYFGYPRAHEDDAVRALRAALEIMAHFGSLEHQAKAPAVRVGVHTGVAVVLGSVMGTLQVAPGRTLDLSDRLMRLAKPGEVITSGITSRLLSNEFHLEKKEPAQTPGLGQASGVFQVQETRALDVQAWEESANLLPLIHREQELELLIDHWQRAVAGHGQIVLVSGEAGIGKSRLVQELCRKLGENKPTLLATQGVSYAMSTPLRPVIDLLGRLFDLRPGDTEERRLQRLEVILESLGFALEATVPIFAGLFGFSFEPGDSPVGLSPQKLRQRTLETIVQVLLAQSAKGPFVLLFEDLHWADPSTLEFLDLLAESIESSSLLLVATSRTAVDGSWATGRCSTRLHLGRLTGSGPGALIDHVTGGRALPTAVREQILEKTDGVPLFIEELTRALLESGRLVEKEGRYELCGSVDGLAIPTTLRDSLTARLDRLGNAKTTAQLAAVIGREFSLSLLRAISCNASGPLEQDLQCLVEARLVHRKGFSPKPRYFFKHALIQDAAYASLLPRDRQRIHLRVAEAMQDAPKVADHQPELLAHHFAAGGNKRQALDYWERAGVQALGRSAHHESTHHFEHGLAVLKEIPASATSSRRELELLSSYGAALVAVEGYGADKVETTFDRVGQLCASRGDTPLEILWRVWPFFLVRGDRSAAFRHLGNFDLEHVDPVHRFVGHTAHGMGKIFDGDFLATCQHLHTAADLFPTVRDELARRQLADAAIYALLYDSWCCWFLGHPELAWSKMETALVEADATGDPHIRASALAFAQAVAHGLRDAARVQELAHRCIALCSEQGFPHWLGTSRCALGWARRSEDPEGAIAMIRQGLDEYLATGARFPRAYWVTYLVETLLDCGRIEEGLEVAEKALLWSRTYLDCFFESEHLRLKAELLHRAGADRFEVERRLAHSFELATSRQAKSFQLRTALRWVRVSASWGAPDQDFQRLAEVVDSFPVGSWSFELEEAKGLLGRSSN